MTTTTATDTAISSLAELGYCVMPLPAKLFEQFDVQAFLCEQVEFINPTATSTKVMGGFGALGNPSSFHHRELRRFRNAVFQHMFAFFGKAFPGQHMQCIPDRFSVRRTNTSVSTESWHQDVSVPSGTGLCFGGWANLDAPDSEPQILSCMPATHHSFRHSVTGFARLQSATLTATFGHSAAVRVQVPPRHCLVFNELLVHQVCPKVMLQDSYRVYLKYLITPFPVMPFGSQIVDRLRDLGVPPYHVRLVERGKKRKVTVEFEYPKMYSSNHVSFNNLERTKDENRIETFSATLAPAFRQVVRPGLANAGKEWVFQTLPSLKQAGISSPLMPEYTEEELAWFAPRLL